MKRQRRRRRPLKKRGNPYRLSVPRTLQIATRRNKSQVLRFVSNQIYKVRPGGTVGGMENVFLRLRANSIYDIMQADGSANAPGTWTPQDPASYGTSVTTVNADGWSDWYDRYFHFTVIGSKITVVFEPTGVNNASSTATNAVPCAVYIVKSGSNTAIATGTEMSDINKLPYTVKGHITPQNSTFGSAGSATYRSTTQAGCALSMGYSAKKFEGVKDVRDNEQLKGAMGSSPATPDEKSYFTVGLRNIIPSGAASDTMVSGVMSIKIEYITLLSEPTTSNQVQLRPFVSGGTTFYPQPVQH